MGRGSYSKEKNRVFQKTYAYCWETIGYSLVYDSISIYHDAIPHSHIPHHTLFDCIFDALRSNRSIAIRL